MSEREALLAECAEVCTSGCHADDCEHHDHLPAERQAGLREAAQSLVDALPYEPGSMLGGKIALLRAALAAQVPAQEERLPWRATADQEERAKWRANERADRLAAALSDLAYTVWGPPRFPYPKDRAGADGVVWTSPESVRSLLDEEVPAQEERLDVERLARALQGTVHSTEVRTLHGHPVRWDDLSEGNREHAFREADWIARAYAKLEPGLPTRSRDAIVALGDLLRDEHGESCDCDTCLSVQPVVDRALGDESKEEGAAEHEHYWVDAADDETGWHCTVCGATEYPEPPFGAEAGSKEPDRP